MPPNGRAPVSHNRTLGIISLVLAIFGATGLIPIGQQWHQVNTYTTALRAGVEPDQLPPRPDPNGVGFIPIGILLVELAALAAGGSVIERVGGRDEEVDTRGLRLAMVGALGACGVLLVMFIASLVYAFVGVATWW